MTNGSRRIYLDLDGVMADFDLRFMNVFGFDQRTVDEDMMWERIHSCPLFFRNMPFCQGARAFWEQIRSFNPIILTACPRTNYAEIATQKRQWVRGNLSPDAHVLPVVGGHNKWLFMHAAGDVLIDDFMKNITPWRKGGGVGIHHTSFEQTWDDLGKIGFMREAAVGPG